MGSRFEVMVPMDRVLAHTFPFTGHQSSRKGSYVSKSCLNRQLVMAKLSYHKPNGFINANILAVQHFLQRASIHVMCALHCV